MMRQLFTLSFATLVALSLNAQSLTSPESVEYDPAYNRYLVSNSGDGTIVARDQGVLSLLSLLVSLPDRTVWRSLRIPFMPVLVAVFAGSIWLRVLKCSM
ncbi:MAG: hypothetical protein IPI91_11730 [Flavobacteriales bacterium]|nr:hypothetical protein [Flavobacteriales bacterium]